MASTRRIGILTGGGDVPGLNSVIKSVVYRATEMGDEVYGIRRGWEGLTHVRIGPELDREYIRPLDRANTRTIDRTGGTVLHTSRTNPKKMKASGLPTWFDRARIDGLEIAEGVFDFTPVVLDNLSALGIDVLVTIGGDDTLSFSRVLADTGFPLVAIPKTMDNDVQGTEYCIGFSSAITRAKELINRQRTTLGSHERLGVFRIFGRDAGFSALFAAYVTSARCVIPEAPYDLERLAAVLADDYRANPSRYAIVITAEGAVWHGAGIESVASELTYDLRSGEADMHDQIVATTFANCAMDLLAGGLFGRMMAIQDGKYAHTELPRPGAGPRKVDVPKMYNVERFRPRYNGKLGEPMLLVDLEEVGVS
jgi:6-phosphofructokinase